MGRKEHKYKINLSFNDLIRKTVQDADSKVISRKDKDTIITKENGKEKILEIKKG